MRPFTLTVLLFVACAHPSPGSVRDETYVLAGEVLDATVAPIVEALDSTPSGRRLTLIIDSPGGAVSSGLELIEHLQNAQYRGVVIVCAVPRYAASMAAVILETCDVRLVGKQALLLFHTSSITGASGNAWELSRLVREIKGINHRLAILVAGRLNMPLKDYEARVEDQDWLLGYEEALAVGAADGVL